MQTRCRPIRRWQVHQPQLGIGHCLLVRRDNLPTNTPHEVLRPKGWAAWSMVRGSLGCKSLMEFGTRSPLARPGNYRSMFRRVSLRRISAGSCSEMRMCCGSSRNKTDACPVSGLIKGLPLPAFIRVRVWRARVMAT